MKSIGIYIHIPFCKTKCPYCDFYSIKLNEELVETYVHQLIEKINLWGKKLNASANTIYFGGGTPGIIGTKRIIKILKSVKSNFEYHNPEITVEINPSDCNLTDFEYMRFEGVNRISIGAQSANNYELSLLGRRHSHQDTVNAIKNARKSGFNNISLDLMLGIQGQSVKSLEYSLNEFIESGVPHISTYLLKIEEGSKYFTNRHKLSLPSEEDEIKLYTLTCNKLKNSGFNHYEISNFSKTGFESAHNLKYWNCQEYLGLGPSAHSFIDGKRFYYPRSIDSFILENSEIPDGEGGSEEEFIMLKLRLSKGLSNKEYIERFNVPIPDKYINNAKKYKNTDLITFNSDGISLTDRGFLLSNRIILDIIR